VLVNSPPGHYNGFTQNPDREVFRAGRRGKRKLAPLSDKGGFFTAAACGIKLKIRLKVDSVETRIALIGIIVEDIEASGRLNAVLHEYSDYIIGRMGIPYRSKGVHVISVVVDAGNDVISSLSGKLGMVRGVTVKTIYAKSRGGPENSGPASDTTA